MRTVKEFKDAGVVFVIGDKCKDNAFSYTKKWVLDKSKDFDVCELTEFAWRNLTTKPDNPQYKIELDIANHRWRPSLNQGEEWPDEQRIDVIGQNGNDGLHYDNATQQFEALASGKPVKPVFTQAMADAGELPPVGSVFVPAENKSDLQTCLGYTSSSKVVGEAVAGGLVSLFFASEIKSIPKTMTVNGFEVPEPMSEAPKFDYRYFAVDLLRDDLFSRYNWKNCSVDHTWLAKGIMHSTESAAIAHAKAMLGIDPNA